ncbi:hypothetical protein Tco_0439809 [Tanacetum coccineum]
MYPKYESKSERKESWVKWRINEDDENDSKDKSDGNVDDNQEGDDTNDDDKETDSDRTESDRIKIPVLNQSTTKYYEEEEEEKIDEETMDDEEDDEVTKELYDDVNVNLWKMKTHAFTNADQGASQQQNDFKNQADNEIASLLDTTARHATSVPKITSSFTTTIPPPPPLFNPLLQQATPTLAPTTSEATTSITSLLDFSSVFKFYERVTNLEKDLSEIKQVDQYAQALSSFPAIVDRAKSQQLTQHVWDLIRDLEMESDMLTYEATASLSEFELTKILLEKIEESKSYLRADYKKKLYDALVESYNTDKDLFNTYGEVFTLKRSRDDNDKDRDPSIGSDRGTKRRKSSKEAESSKDSRSKEKKSSSNL